MNFHDTVPGHVWQDLISGGHFTRYKGGDVLVRQGEPAKHVVALTNGAVKVIRLTEDGSSSVLALRGSGELVGELGTILDKPHSATVTTIGSATGYDIGFGLPKSCCATRTPESHLPACR